MPRTPAKGGGRGTKGGAGGGGVIHIDKKQSQELSHASLKRADPYIQRVLVFASHTVAYESQDGQAWVRGKRRGLGVCVWRDRVCSLPGLASFHAVLPAAFLLRHGTA